MTDKQAGTMQVDILEVGPFQVNCFVIHGQHSQALVVDPGGDVDRLVDHLTAANLHVKAYLLTHGHPDHISGLNGMIEHFPAPVLLHASDAAWAFSQQNQVLPYYPPPVAPPETFFEVIREGCPRKDAGLDFTVLETPGHTPGGVCFYFPETRSLFAGDTLFAGSVGRTDLPGGNSGQLMQSLRRLATFTHDVRVFSGHGPTTTLGQELKQNPFMQRAMEKGKSS